MNSLSLNDIITLIILVVFVYFVGQGYRRGFIKQAAFVINSILGFILAPVLMPIFWGIFHELQVDSQLEKYIQGFLSAFYYSHTSSGVLLQTEITDATIVAADEITRRILSQNAGIIAANITRVVSYAFGFIVIRLVLHFVFDVSAFISKLPIIHQFDKAIGALSSGLMTILSIWIILVLMSMLIFIPGVGIIFEKIIQVPVLQAFMQINPFGLLIQAVEMIR